MRRVPVTTVAKIVSGKTPKGIDEKFKKGDEIPFFRVADMNVKGNEVEMQISENSVSEQIASKLKLKIAKPGTVIFPKRGGAIATNKKRILVKPSAYDLNTMGLVPNEKVNKKYFFHWFNSIDLEALADGSSVPQLNNKQIEPLEIPLPSLSEQKAIVAKLDRAQRLIDIDRQMLVKYDQLIQSVFLEMFGDPNEKKVPLSKLIELNPKKSEISHLDKSQFVTFLGMTNIGEDGSLNLTNQGTILDYWKGYTYFREGDVLFAKITPCMENGKGAIASGLKNGIGFGSTEFHVLRPLKGVSSSAWIFHLTHSEKFRRIAESNMTGSAGQRRVPSHFFDRFMVSKPSIKKQIQFEKIAGKVNSEKQRLKCLIENSEKLFSSLIQQAFNLNYE